MSKCSWPMRKIEELFKVQLGKMLNKKAMQGELFPYLANFNVRWGSFDLSRLNKMAFSEKEQKKFSLLPGDLLMCEGGEIGRCAIWNRDDRPIYYQKALHRLRPLGNNMISIFVFYYMQHIASKGELPKLVGETSIAHLTREKLLCLQIPCPPLPEQTAIADLLSTWDAAIEKIKKLIVAKEKRFLWLRMESFKEKSKNCHEAVLSDICSIKKGQQLSKVDMIENGKYYVLNGGITASGYTDKWNTQKNTITISEGGNSCGFVSFNEELFWCGGHCYSLNELDPNMGGVYLYHFLKCHEKKIMRLRVGSGLPNIQRKDVENIHISFPTISEQKQVGETLNTAQHEIELLNNLADSYRKQKRGLMQKLLTGLWRVRIH